MDNKLITLWLSLFLPMPVMAMESQNHGADIPPQDLILKLIKREFEDHPRNLHYACKTGDFQAAEMLIASETDMNAKDAYGMTPLHWAATQGYPEITRLLIQNKADVHIQDNVDRTPLHRAASKGDVYSAQLLIDKGACVNSLAKFNRTPLHFAAQNGRLNIVQLLINHGAEINAQDEDGKTPLQLVFARSTDLNSINDSRRILFKQIAEQNNVNVIKALLKGQLRVKSLSPFSTESLQNICAHKLFNDQVYDNESITDTIVPCLDNFEIKYEKQFINIRLCKKIAQSYVSHGVLPHKSNKNITPQQIETYCKQYLAFIKSEINNEVLLIARRIKNNHDFTNLIKAINSSQSFDELPEDMQDIIYDTNILK